MNPAFAARFPLEVLHRVRDVNLLAVDSGILQGAVEDFSSRADEWFARDIFLITWLFPEQHQYRAFRTFAENGLGRVFEKMAGGAVFRGALQRGEARCFRH